MDDKLQRALREAERSGVRLVPRPPDALLEALKTALTTGIVLELPALRDWLTQFCEGVSAASDGDLKRIEELNKILDQLQRLQELQRSLDQPAPPSFPTVLPGPYFEQQPFSGVIPLGLGPSYHRHTGMPIVGFPVTGSGS